MTQMQKIYFSALNSTVNRGVEARENDISKDQYDQEQVTSSRTVTEGSDDRAGGELAAGDARPRPPHSPPSISDPSGSYVKAGGENTTVPAAVLLACPAFAALHQHHWDKDGPLFDICKEDEANPRTVENTRNDKIYEKRSKNSFWKTLHCASKQDLGLLNNGPDRVEIYHFERTNEYLCARDAVRMTQVERVARRLQRPAAALLAELLAVPRLLLALPVAVILQIQRCALLGARSAVTGLVQTMSDQLLKPALALVFNALVQPPLVFAAQTFGALRDALRPLALALGDALAPLVRVLSALRVVHVERQCSCTHRV